MNDATSQRGSQGRRVSFTRRLGSTHLPETGEQECNVGHERCGTDNTHQLLVTAPTDEQEPIDPDAIAMPDDAPQAVRIWVSPRPMMIDSRIDRYEKASKGLDQWAKVALCLTHRA